MSLTGRIKYRVGWPGKIVLQVEERKWQSVGFASGYVTEWRDANIQDFNLLSMKAPDPCPGEQAQDTSTEKT